MNKDSKNRIRKVLAGLLIIGVSIGLGYCLFLATRPLIHGKEQVKMTMNEKNEKNPKNQESVTGNNKEEKQVLNNSNKLTIGELLAKQIGEEQREKAQREERLKETSQEPKRERTKVKGIYVSGPRAGSGKYMDDLIDIVDNTELNTMVIDIKNDSGEITYDMNLPVVKEIKANKNYIRNIKELVRTLKEKNIYVIGRVVAFKDPVLAEKKPKLSIKNSNGTIFRDRSGLAWVNPYKKEVWDYLMDICKEAAQIGIDEIQFDYIRFSTDKGMKTVNFGKEARNKSKLEVITEFTKYAKETLSPLGIYVSADVYGAIIDSEVDADIVGQSYVEMSKYLDYISPMVYPSHYADGSYGIPHPDLEPYKLILKSMEASKAALDAIPEDEDKAIVRPWLQDFTASWLKNHKSYNGKEIKDQIKAVYDAGYDEWILWNGSNKYTKSGLELAK